METCSIFSGTNSKNSKFSRTPKSTFLPYDLSEKNDDKLLRKLENLLPKQINEENTYGIRALEHLRNENPYRIIIGHININLIRNKLASFVKYVGNNLNTLMVLAIK